MLLILLQIVLNACAQIQPRFHTVVSGETLGKIAALYSVQAYDVREKNHDVLKAGLRPGTRLYIPFEEAPGWTTEWSSERASEWDGSLASDIVKNAKRDMAAVQAGFPGFIWPVIGNVSSAFGLRSGNMHDGIDIAAAEGTTVKAARSGHVIYAHNRIGGYGNMVILRHADSYSTVYAHLSLIHVKKGQFIAKGLPLGRVGQTGDAEGPHLHFEVRNNRIPVNPLLYLQVQVANNILRRN